MAAGNARDAILEVLAAAQERPVSGEDLAVQLGITRAAVWKHIESLRRSGYLIKATPRRGYRLLGNTDLPVANKVQPLLQTKFVGRHYLYYSRLESTNLEARRLAEEGAPEGTVVVADEQTSGRGRRGRAWLSKPDAGIWCSIILRPSLPTGQAGALMLMSAVAVREAIQRETGLPVTIKWPNDLLIHRRKVCGILLELAANQESLRWTVLGIGINVRPPAGGFPGKLAATSIALEQALAGPVYRPRLLACVCERLEHWYGRLEAGFIPEVLAAWRAGCDWLGARVDIQQGDKVYPAVALDIQADGGLAVSDLKGNRHVIHAGEVSIRYNDDNTGTGGLAHPVASKTCNSKNVSATRTPCQVDRDA